MKNIYIILLTAFLMSFFCHFGISQNNFHNRHILDPYNPEYAEGVVLIKFKDDVKVRANMKQNLASTGLESIDMVLEKYEASEIGKVFQTEERKEKRFINNPAGGRMEVPQLFNIYKLEFASKADAKEFAEELSKDPYVEFAEPDYFVYTMDVIPDDPLYQDGSQSYIDAIHAPAAWDLATGEGQIIGIIDTGVDWDHPDLDDNIWENEDEIPGNGVDDDGNGYVDDVRGWDFVNNDNNPNDDNSHGTHVAGIAAAESNNGVGIVGVAFDAKIMPVKMLQSSGTGNSSDLASAIEYASENGATVINMSLGSYGESMAVKTALENAYAGTGDGEGSMLVAAAGNDHKKVSIADPCKTYGLSPMPMFPGAYSWVIGVMAEDAGPCDGFSNWDFDGPVAFEGFNYEIQAKGVGIISCKPNGSYWPKSGTSMASPEVAGAVALMRQYHPDDSGEEIFAKLIQGSNSGLLDIYSGMTALLVPNLIYINYTIVDTLPGCDRDGVADAGETIQLFLTIKNAGGQADSVWTKIRFGQFEDTTTAHLIDTTSFIGSMSAYATMKGELDPFIIEIDSDVANNREIVFEYEILDKDSIYRRMEFNITTQKGIELSGMHIGKTILKPNYEYLITANSVFDSLIVKPGTTIKLNDGISITISSFIECIGKPDSLIVFTKNTGYWREIKNVSNNNFTLSYCIFEYSGGYSNKTATSLQEFSINNCIFRYLYNNVIPWRDFPQVTSFTKNNIINNQDIYPGIFIFATNSTPITNNLFSKNSIVESASLQNGYSIINYQYTPTFFSNNTFIDNQNYDFSIHGGYWQIFSLPSNYWGFNDSASIENSIADYFEFSDKPVIMGYNNRQIKPSAECHGVVWKIDIKNILVNKYDNPFNSTTGLGVVGAETLQFDVYFNRAMDTTYTPLLTFGVREPYTQHIVADSSYWSADSTIWSAYTTVGMETGDGIQRVRVANARDDERFEIPIEDSRFEFVIQAAGAASIDFVATPGIGKIDLEWPAASTEDLLGYNLHRFYNITDNTFSDTLLINTELILDTLFTDFNVIPETTYHYLYTIIGTDMAESDYSKRVSATPFTAANGDANGDMNVNVLDITSIVAYMLNQNPQPFLFDAADVNGDNQINVLDIIGAVQIIMGTKSAPLSQLVSVNPEPAFISIEGDKMMLESKGQVAAMQFNLSCEKPEDIKLLCKIPGFEMASSVTGKNTITGILYNFTQKIIPAGIKELIHIESDQKQEITIGEVICGDLNGDYVPILKYGLNIEKTEALKLEAFPNPFTGETTIKFELPEDAGVRVIAYDHTGNLVAEILNKNLKTGTHELKWNTNDKTGLLLPNGIYFVRITTKIKEDLITSNLKLILLR